MDTEIKRISKLIDRNWNGPMWHGTHLSEILKEISWQAAFAKPQNASHNTYEYVRHMITWRRFTIEHLNGNSGYTVEINSNEDWPTGYEISEPSWQKALHDLEADQSALVAGIADMPDTKLDEQVPGKKFKWYALLHCIIHHDIYHSAQIALLKKLTVGYGL